MSAEWRFLITLNEHLGPVRDPVTVQEVALRLLGEHLGDCNVHYTVIEGDEFFNARAYTTDVPPFVARGPISMFGKAIPDAARRGETVVVDDIATDPRLPESDRELLLRAGNLSAMVGVPLIKDGRWVAVLGIQSAKPREWTADQIHVIQITADRMWSAAERARAEEALGKSESRQAFLQRLNDAIRPLADPARVLAETCRLLALHMGVNRVAYGEIEGGECVIVGEYAHGVPSRLARFRWEPLGGSRAANILQGETLVVNDTSVPPHTPEETALLQASGVGAYLCPMIVKHGRFIGTLGIHNRKPRVWTPDDVALAEDVADRLWTTLEHRRAEADLRANEERLAFLLRLNDALRPLIDPAAVQQTAARLLGEHLQIARVAYADFERSGTYFIRHEHVRGVAPLGGSPRTVDGAIGEALLRAEPVVVTNVEEDARLTAADRDRYRGMQTASFVTTTLFKDGQRVAGFGAAHDRPRVWTQTEVDLIRDVAERTWDAVERARAEAALREQDKRLRLALEASAGGSWSWVAATNQVDWDDRCRALYGFTPDEPARTDAWLPRVHEEDRQRMCAAMQEMMSSTTGTSWEHTFRIVKPDGTVRWVQSRARADRDDDGRVLRLTGLDLDFDRHRRLEEAERAQRDEEHDRALRTLLETATQGIVSVDADGVIVSANQAFEAMFGWPPGELIGQQAGRMMPQAFLDGLASQGSHEVIGVRRDGSSFPIELTVNRVPSPTGGRAFAFVTDITERQRAAAALRARTIELERRTTQLSQMASDVTLAERHAREQIAKTLHDGLQQLLVIASTNLDRQAQRDADRGEAPSELLSAASGHLTEAIAAARSLSIELYPPVLQRSGLPAALQWLASWVHDKYGLEVHAEVDMRADSARKDVRTLLFESVRELLFNALKHAQAGRVSVELALDAEDQLCITVSDRGVGFDAKLLHDRTNSGQTGWGLFSIRERLTLLGGRFDIDSAPGQGTRVRLVAPRGAAPGAPASATLRATPVGPETSERREAAADALRILVVDDHKIMRAALREIIHERPQLSVIGEAADGLEAIASARALSPDVILMDASMPHLDGFEATERIHAELPHIEILGLSMQGRSEAGPAFEQAGAAGYFVKGTDMQRLVDHLLHVHQARCRAV